VTGVQDSEQGEQERSCYLQLPVLIAFSVQFAAELMSWAAPRTVLHAVTIRQHPMKSAAVTLEIMSCPSGKEHKVQSAR
jgi:hypothetical protein